MVHRETRRRRGRYRFSVGRAGRLRSGGRLYRTAVPIRPARPVPDTDLGCGFDYSGIMWETASVEQQNLLLNARHPLGESAEIRIVANFSQYDTDFRYAPSVGTFRFDPTRDQDLLNAINVALAQTPPLYTADDNDLFFASHRFVGHGNRNWRTESEVYDITAGVEGRLTSWLGYDAKLNLIRQDATVRGNTFVHEGKIAEEIRTNRYDLRNPFSRDPDHRQAILDTSLRHERDVGAESQSLRAALEGSGFSIGGRKAAWTAGVEIGRTEAHSLLRFVDREGTAYDVSEVLGSGGVSYAGEREALGVFAETLLPVMERLDLRFAGPRGRDRRRGRAALLARRGRIPAHGRADRAGFVERGARRSRVFPTVRHLVPGLALCRVCPRTRADPPHMLRAERAPGRAPYGREPRSGSGDRRPACRGGRVREGALTASAWSGFGSRLPKHRETNPPIGRFATCRSAPGARLPTASIGARATP